MYEVAVFSINFKVNHYHCAVKSLQGTKNVRQKFNIYTTTFLRTHNRTDSQT